MEFRRIFDTIPDQFDKFRPRYSRELFQYMIDFAEIGPGKEVLEIGPGTGQATDPILETGCDYYAIELGEHLYAKMKEKYDRFSNFHIVNDDFITYNYERQRFDVIYSAATIQWIPEEIAFTKTYELLKPVNHPHAHHGPWTAEARRSSCYDAYQSRLQNSQRRSLYKDPKPV